VRSAGRGFEALIGLKTKKGAKTKKGGGILSNPSPLLKLRTDNQPIQAALLATAAAVAATIAA
jgi:hypothetical protein